jgi:hypothetical protein
VLEHDVQVLCSEEDGAVPPQLRQPNCPSPSDLARLLMSSMLTYAIGMAFRFAPEVYSLGLCQQDSWSELSASECVLSRPRPKTRLLL